MIKTILSRNGYKIKKADLDVKTLKEINKIFFGGYFRQYKHSIDLIKQY